MDPKLSITPLTGEDGSPIIIVDFTAFGVDATLTELIKRAPQGHAVHRIDVVADLSTGDTLPAVAELAERYAALARSRDLRPRAILGYCSASVLALHLSEALSRAGSGPVPTVLVEPTWVGDREVAAAVEWIRRSLGAAAVPPEQLDLDAILKTLEVDALDMMRRDDIPEDEQEDMLPLLLGRYRAWVGYLVIARAAEVPGPGATSGVVASTESARGSAPGWPAQAVTVLRFDGSIEGLLRSSDVRAWILGQC